MRLEPGGERRFGLVFGFAEGCAESLVLGQGLESFELAQVGDPAVANGSGDDLRQRRIGEQEKAALGDAVGLIVETLGEQLGEIRHHTSSSAGP